MKLELCSKNTFTVSVEFEYGLPLLVVLSCAGLSVVQGGALVWATACIGPTRIWLSSGLGYFDIINTVRIVCGAGWIYETVERPSVPLFDSSGVRRVCCWAPCGQEISRQQRAPAPSSNSAQAWRLTASVGSVVLTAEGRGWTQTCLLSEFYATRLYMPITVSAGLSPRVAPCQNLRGGP